MIYLLEKKYTYKIFPSSPALAYRDHLPHRSEFAVNIGNDIMLFNMYIIVKLVHTTDSLHKIKI